MTTISATSILRSRNAARPEKVLSTILCRYPRFIHAEMMTHRAFSRNAASSRAIPLKKQIAAVIEDPAVPLWWGKEQKGMQAHEELTGMDRENAKDVWYGALHLAVESALRLADLGAHKQIVNRIIEPFTHITVLISATEWDNFLELRDHPAAEPHMQMLARAIRHELETTPVQTLQPGEWHLPFVTAERWTDGAQFFVTSDDEADLSHDDAIRLSVGRCASTSYKTVDGFDMTLERATALHDRFVNERPQHASPLEHVAKADVWYDGSQGTYGSGWGRRDQHANFVGFRQYRHML